MNKQVYEVTQEGLEELKAELRHIKDELIPANIEALVAARAQGDLSENADYDAARDEQARLDARVKQLEEYIKNAKIIEKSDLNVISTGSHVNVTYIGLNQTFDYQIVGTIQASPLDGKISNEAPLGKAIIGHKPGDVVTVITETGKEHKVRINSIK
ncbi:MAG: transcription elongation factor GreA [Anaeroplasmataceae bacterium]